MSNNSGNTAKIMDLPYPVGNATKVSFPETNVLKASSCLGLNCLKSIRRHTSATAALKSIDDAILKNTARSIEWINHRLTQPQIDTFKRDKTSRA